MNIIFTIITITSLIMLCFKNPQLVLPTMLSGGEKAINLCLTLLPSYCLWLGFFTLLEACGLDKKFAKTLNKPVKKLFYKTDENSCNLISLNISANLLGMGGIATPLGISACNNMQTHKNFKGISLLFVLSCAGLCFLPTSVISLRAKHASTNAYSIIIPTLLTSLFCALIGIILVKIFIKNENC